MGDSGPLGDDATVGEGEFPPELDRVNWAAFMFSGLWALLYGAWGWLATMLFVVFGMTAINLWTIDAQPTWPLGWRLLLYASYAACSLAVTLGLAFRANRHVWRVQHDRLAGSVRIAIGRVYGTVGDYLARQATFARVGFVLLVLNLTWNVYSATPYRRPTAILNAVVWAAAILGVWVFDRQRSSRALDAGMRRAEPS